jgi:hypothetical protein
MDSRYITRVKTSDFYPRMKDRCKAYSFPEVSPSMLPEYTLIISDRGTDVELYSVCFYNTDSNLAWLGWELGNHEAPKELKKGALSQLIKGAEAYAKELGYDILFTTSKTKPVIQALRGLGFVEGDTDVNHYLKLL